MLRILSIILLISPLAQAKDDDPPPGSLTASQFETIQNAPVGIATPIEPSLTLYHWTNSETIHQIADEMNSHHRLPLVDPTGASNLAGHFPEFRSRRVIFAWVNPVTAMGTEHVEMYGDQVVKFWIRPDAKAAVLVSEGGEWYPKNDHNRNYDLVLHIEKGKSRTGKIVTRLREWVILNWKAVQKISADPQVIRSDIVPWYLKAKDPHFHFAEKDLHFNGSIYEPGRAREFFIVTRLRNWLTRKPGEIPSRLRGETTFLSNALDPATCGELMDPPALPPRVLPPPVVPPVVPPK